MRAADPFTDVFGTGRGERLAATAERQHVVDLALTLPTPDGEPVIIEPGDRYIGVAIAPNTGTPVLTLSSDSDAETVLHTLRLNHANGFETPAVLDLHSPDPERPLIAVELVERDGEFDRLHFDERAPSARRLTIADVFGQL